jgi:tetratricopeptide (TPR) repeat protein
MAMALLALGHPGEAAVRLDTLARQTESGAPEERADLMMQSGEAWLIARRGDLAEASFSAALMLTPRDAEVWAARARARAMEEKWEGSESDLDSAIVFENATPEYYFLRSAARKALGKDADAIADINTALRLDPAYPDALAERGLMRFAAGDENGARADWIVVLNTAPDSAAADVARLGIERMEIHIEP